MKQALWMTLAAMGCTSSAFDGNWQIKTDTVSYTCNGAPGSFSGSGTLSVSGGDALTSVDSANGCQLNWTIEPDAGIATLSPQQDTCDGSSNGANFSLTYGAGTLTQDGGVLTLSATGSGSVNTLNCSAQWSLTATR